MKRKTTILIMAFAIFLGFSAMAQEVRIDPNTKITIESGTYMNITTGNLVLESNSDGDASLIVLGGVRIDNSGKTVAQRYLPGNSALAWHTIGAPVSGMAISGSDFEPRDDVAPNPIDDFYAWDEPSPGTWVNYKQTTGDLTFTGVNNGDNFVAAKGYLVAYDDANPTKEFTGTLNTGDKTFTIEYSTKKDWTYVKG